MLTYLGSTVTSHYHKLVKRCWSKVISGRPTLAKVVVAGSFFALFALVAGAGLFFYIYFRHKDHFAEIEEELVSGKRRYKPQLEDAGNGLCEKHASKRGWWEKLCGKKRKRSGDEEAPKDENDQIRGGDLREPNQNMTQRKATGNDGKEHHKEKRKTTKKRVKSKKSDPKKKNKKLRANRNLKKKGKRGQPNRKKEEAREKPEDRAAGETLEDLWNMRMQEVQRAKQEENIIDQRLKVKKPEAADRANWEKSRVPPTAQHPDTASTARESSQE
ncbi:uncharacterized protein [Eleutherodactylus coqui]|uniref:uncharacterized protein isoform X2 n=1 Tax=Eleutherodactylus coqui TaxID=57060 RepID=UPI0034629BAD